MPGITQHDLEIFHAAAKMIEADGVEAYFSCAKRFGFLVAGAVLVTYLRAKTIDPNRWPDDTVQGKVDQILQSTGRLQGPPTPIPCPDCGLDINDPRCCQNDEELNK